MGKVAGILVFKECAAFFDSSQKSVKPLILARADELYCWSQHKAHGNRSTL